jgi:hypothetical protein
MPFFISFCRSRSFLVFLLGAGVSGALAASALAGDKIEFSPISDNLAMPTVDRPDSEPAEPSPFSLKNPQQNQRLLFAPMVPPPVVAASRRKVDPIFRNGNGGLSSDQDKFGRNDNADNSARDMSATNYSYSFKPATNSNYLDGVKAWGTPENPDDRGHGTDKLDPRYVQPDARLGSRTSPQTRDGPSETGSGMPGSRAWASRRDDDSASGAKTSDALKQPDKSLPGANPSLFKSLFPAPGAVSAWGSSPLMPSDQPLLSPLNKTDPGYNAYKDSSGRLFSGRSSSRLDEGNTGGLPAPSAWGNAPGYGFQSSDPAPAFHKTPPPPATGVPQRPQGGAFLPTPKNPNSVFN